MCRMTRWQHHYTQAAIGNGGPTSWCAMTAGCEDCGAGTRWKPCCHGPSRRTRTLPPPLTAQQTQSLAHQRRCCHVPCPSLTVRRLQSHQKGKAARPPLAHGSRLHPLRTSSGVSEYWPLRGAVVVPMYLLLASSGLLPAYASSVQASARKALRWSSTAALPFHEQFLLRRQRSSPRPAAPRCGRWTVAPLPKAPSPPSAAVAPAAPGPPPSPPADTQRGSVCAAQAVVFCRICGAKHGLWSFLGVPGPSSNRGTPAAAALDRRHKSVAAAVPPSAKLGTTAGQGAATEQTEGLVMRVGLYEQNRSISAALPR